MKYKLLLKVLRVLVYGKRFFWWLGPKVGRLFLRFFALFWRPFVYFSYKTDYLLKKLGMGREKIWWLKRDNLQVIMFVLLVLIALPQTKVFAKTDSYLAGQKSVAYRLFGQVEELEIEEIAVSADEEEQVSDEPTYKSGAVGNDAVGADKTRAQIQVPELGSSVAGGIAVTKPLIIPGASIAGENRKEVVDYVVKPGDSLSSIAYRFGVSSVSVMWANDMTSRSIIRPGDKLKIPPVSGVLHTIKSGDTLSKIAKKYDVTEEKIVKFNVLSDDGSDLVVGEQIMIPDGVMPQTYVAPVRTYSSYSTIATPAPSTQGASVSGYVWPSAARTITQYYSWRHTGLDIAGAWQSAIYAAKSGTVEKSQCGWNGGYGCYIIINHGGGVKTLYGHNSKLLVSAGDYVSAGQTISLMGNTGRVYGRTGIHLHFEVIINGVRRNPLSYVR